MLRLPGPRGVQEPPGLRGPRGVQEPRRVQGPRPPSSRRQPPPPRLLSPPHPFPAEPRPPRRPQVTLQPPELRAPPSAPPCPAWFCASPAAVGDTVKQGDEVIVLEAMKMETPVSATVSGTVRAVLVSQGDQVKTGAPLIEIA